jgi:hypothetical protein
MTKSQPLIIKIMIQPHTHFLCPITTSRDFAALLPLTIGEKHGSTTLNIQIDPVVTPRSSAIPTPATGVSPETVSDPTR